MVKEVYVNAIKRKIPKTWEVKLVKEISNYVAGSTFPKEEQGEINGDIPFYKVSDMNKFNVYMGEANNYVSEEIANKLNLNICPSGTVIFPKLGQALLTNKRRILSQESAFDNNVAGLIAEQVNEKYLYYSLLKIKFNALCNPGTVPSLNKKTINAIDIIYPTLKEQKKIADILSSVDKTIEKTDQVIEKTKELKKGLMQQLLTKGIGHDEFKEVKVPLLPVKWKLPKNWKVKFLKDLTNKITDGAHQTPTYVDEGIPFLRVTDIQEHEIDWEKTKKIPEEEHIKLTKRCKPEKGDILLSKNGTIGITKIVDWNKEFSNFVSLCLIKPNKELVYNKYLSIILGSEFCLQQAAIGSKTGTVTNLHLTEIRKFNIPVPPLEEQKKIANILSTVDEKIQKEEEYKARLERLKKGLMQKLLTGEVRVNVDDIKEA